MNPKKQQKEEDNSLDSATPGSEQNGSVYWMESDGPLQTVDDNMLGRHGNTAACKRPGINYKLFSPQ